MFLFSGMSFTNEQKMLLQAAYQDGLTSYQRKNFDLLALCAAMRIVDSKVCLKKIKVSLNGMYYVSLQKYHLYHA